MAHTPVMLENIQALLPSQPGVYVDCTFGRGGYTEALLKHHPDTRVIGIDRDKEAISWGTSHLLPQYPSRLTLVHERFSRLSEILTSLNHSYVDGIIFDLGVSSPQLDQAERGFSFMRQGPLDMRMGLNTHDAASFINTASVEEIETVIRTLGEERHARKLAQKISDKRAEKPFETTQELTKLAQETLPYDPSGIHPATRLFQALRLWVNQELNELEKALFCTPSLLVKGGLLMVVSFHSLEDRIVKHFLNTHSKKKSVPNRHLPYVLEKSSEKIFHVPGKQPLFPSQQEMKRNPRSRSARLRYAVRLETEKTHP